ncbi:hypothetical protein C1646_768164 [Rhizophagus diaphanus]|nr:hypothetical protein C1646_768164 [Rhizophagus diaphanus] [Rhizophagus sp. MUCL 43196]
MNIIALMPATKAYEILFKSEGGDAESLCCVWQEDGSQNFITYIPPGHDRDYYCYHCPFFDDLKNYGVDIRNGIATYHTLDYTTTYWVDFGVDPGDTGDYTATNRGGYNSDACFSLKGWPAGISIDELSLEDLDCTFVIDKITVKALIDPKSRYNSISKMLAQKIGLYITRIYGSEYPTVKDLGISVTNTGKKVMVKGWIRDEVVSISLPNIFELKLLSLGCRIDKCDARYWENNKEKRLYYVRNNIDILSPPLYTFYELLFPNFTENNSDGEVIITKFFKHYMAIENFDLSEYYDSEYTETESEYSYFEDETESEG